MKKSLIGTVVAALILFIWQFLSWSVLNIHGPHMQYTPNQDAILEVLENNLEAGQYFLPNVAPGTSSEDYETYMENATGKPWAQISYHDTLDNNMAMSLIRGFIIDLIAAWLLVWILLKFAKLDFITVLFSALAVGIIGYLSIPYLKSVWFETNSWPDLIDALAAWGLAGVWLGWWLTKK